MEKTPTFEEPGEGVRVGHKVRNAVPGGLLFERMIERIFVRPDVRKIFDYRMKRLGELFNS